MCISRCTCTGPGPLSTHGSSVTYYVAQKAVWHHGFHLAYMQRCIHSYISVLPWQLAWYLGCCMLSWRNAHRIAAAVHDVLSVAGTAYMSACRVLRLISLGATLCTLSSALNHTAISPAVLVRILPCLPALQNWILTVWDLDRPNTHP